MKFSKRKAAKAAGTDGATAPVAVEDRTAPAVRGGALIRRHVGNDDWWLTRDESAELDRQNAALTVDEDFWKWWDGFAADKHLVAAAKYAPITRGKGDRDGGWSWGEDSKTYLKKVWSGWYGGSLDEDQRLANALRTVDTAIHAIRTEPGHYRVVFAADNIPGATKGAPVNFSALGDALVVVSPSALLDTAVDADTAVRITTAFGMHEAGHTEHSIAPYKAISAAKLAPPKVAGMLLNIAEDVRIERLVGADYPGFAPYFGEALDFMWGFADKKQDGHWKAGDISRQINFAIQAIRWHDQLAELVKQAGDPKAATELTWWTDWSERYASGSSDAVTTVREALDHLRQDPDVAKQMAAMPQDEGQDTAPDGCSVAIARNGQHVTDAQAQSIDRIVAEKLGDMNVRNDLAALVGGTTGDKRIVTRRPVEDADSAKLLPTPNHGLMRRLRSAFMFRPVEAETFSRRLMTGEVDDDELWRVKDYDHRVFQQRRVESKPAAHVTLAVDMSGSMDERKTRIAQELAYVIFGSLKDEHGATIRVRAWTDGVDNHRGTTWYRIWDPGDPESRLGILRQLDRGGTPTSYAVVAGINELLGIGKTEDQRLLVILSDGEPGSARSEVKAAVSWGERHGVTVVELCIDRTSDQGDMFRLWLPYRDPATLPPALGQLLRRVL